MDPNIVDSDGNIAWDVTESVFGTEGLHNESLFTTVDGFDTLSLHKHTDDWPHDFHPSNSYDSMAPFDDGLFGDLDSDLTSPDLSHCCSSSPEPHNHHHQHDTIAQSIELDPFECGSGCTEHHNETSDPFGLHHLLHDSAFTTTPFDFDDPSIDSYFSYHHTPTPPCLDSRQPSLCSDFEYTPSSSRQPSRAPRLNRSISTGPILSGRITKRPASLRRLTAPTSSARSTPARNATPATTPTNTFFPCPLAPYGCTSSFASKNEWKRHVGTQHLRLDLWRCDACALANRDARPNDFNRKDLFVQHLRRMHLRHEPSDGPAVAAAEARCRVRVRDPPARSACPFCDHTFVGQGSWDERMEHVGRHLEGRKRAGLDVPAVDEWNVDKRFEEWLRAEGLIAFVDGEWKLAR